MSRGRSPALFSFFTLIKKYSVISTALLSLLCVKEARSIIFQIIVISCKQNVYHFFPVDAKAMLKTKAGWWWWWWGVVKLVNREVGV